MEVNREEKEGLHPRNRHRGRYDFERLVKSSPELKKYVLRNAYNVESIDFTNPAAIKALNRALLKEEYGIRDWDIPDGYLCPPIPGRADYIHNLADLLGACNEGAIPIGSSVRVFDVGVGASCIYPIIGHQEYGWRFVGSDVDPAAVASAKKIVAANPSLSGAVEIREQKSPLRIFGGVMKAGECYDLTMCNPPFHASRKEAEAQAQRSSKGLVRKGGAPSYRNFGGQSNELWCKGGEEQFVGRMIEESAGIPEQCLWFTTLVSKSEHLRGFYRKLKQAGAVDVRTVEMAQAQKVRRVVAWSFLSRGEQEEWRERWT